MSKIVYPDYSDKEYWENEISKYYEDGPTLGFVERHFWNYFKYCFRCGNRYFFQHSLLPRIKQLLKENAVTVPSGTTVYRARVDKDCRLYEINKVYRNVRFYESELSCPTENGFVSKYPDECRATLRELLITDGLEEYRNSVRNGFEGYNATESGAPPNEKASAGRCNPDNVSFLYTAKEPHTAVAEIRPYIHDSISVSRLSVTRELRLVDFYNEMSPEGIWEIDDMLFDSIASDFSKINKGNEKEYTPTQYITSLIQEMGFDGLCFRSSLVKEGKNYVFFNPDVCEIVASKLYIIPDVEYKLLPVSDEIHI